MFKNNPKSLELPDLPDFKAEKKPSIFKPAKKEKIIEVSELMGPSSEKDEKPKKKLKRKWETLKKIKKEHHFILRDGRRIKNLEELTHFLKFMDESTFKHHVTNDKNDFADWIKNIVEDNELANNIKGSKSKEHMLRHLEFNKNQKELLKNELKEKENIAAEKELRKKQAEIEKLSKKQIDIPKERIEKKEIVLMKKEDTLKKREKIIREKQKELESKKKQFEFIEKKKKEIDEKDARFKEMKKELFELKEKQKNIEKKKEILKREAELFLKKEGRITEKNEFLERLINENNEIKGKLVSKEKSLVDMENELRKRAYGLLVKENLLEEKKEKKVHVPRKIKQSVKKGIKKEKVKSTKKVRKKEHEKTKKIGKEDVSFMIKEINDYASRGDISKAKLVLSKMMPFYNGLNKQDKESLKYDIMDSETNIKIASLNL